MFTRALIRFALIAAVLCLRVPQPTLGADAVVSGACLETDFNTAWAAADTGAGGAITFACGSVTEIVFTGTKTLASGRAITIDGAGAMTLTGYLTLAPLVETRLFSVTNAGSTLTIKNLTLNQGRAAANGGAILAGAGSLIIVDNSTVRNGKADAGGAISASGGSLIIRDSAFISNTAAKVGGAIDATDSISITGSAFRGNVASAFGGGECHGGAVSLRTSQAQISNSAFDGNVGAGGGGALCVDSTGSVTLTRVSLTGNSAADGGGALYTRAGAVLIRDSSLISGNSVYGVPGSGGGVFAIGPITITGSAVSGNTSGDGGGIYAIGPISLQNSVVAGNTAVDWDGTCSGGGIVTRLSLEALNTQIVSNTANAAGGFGKGGGICLRNGQMTLEGVTLRGNNAGNMGGAIYALDGTSAVIANSALESNAAEAGGGLFSMGEVELSGSAILSNTAVTSGGGMYLSSSPSLSMTNALVRANVASDFSYGGGIFLADSAAVIQRSLFAANAGPYGGALALLGGVLTLTNSTLSGNIATSAGGGIWAGVNGLLRSSDVGLSLFNVTLAQNVSALGSGLYRAVSSPFTTTVTLANAAFDKGKGINGPLCSGGISSAAYSRASDAACFAAGATNDVGPVLLGPLADNEGQLAGAPGQKIVIASHLPLAGSPLINTGQDLSGIGITVDQRELARPQGPAFEIGAVEVGLTPKVYAPRILR